LPGLLRFQPGKAKESPLLIPPAGSRQANGGRIAEPGFMKVEVFNKERKITNPPGGRQVMNTQYSITKSADRSFSGSLPLWGGLGRGWRNANE